MVISSIDHIQRRSRFSKQTLRLFQLEHPNWQTNNIRMQTSLPGSLKYPNMSSCCLLTSLVFYLVLQLKNLFKFFRHPEREFFSNRLVLPLNGTFFRIRRSSNCLPLSVGDFFLIIFRQDENESPVFHLSNNAHDHLQFCHLFSRATVGGLLSFFGSHEQPSMIWRDKKREDGEKGRGIDEGSSL